MEYKLNIFYATGKEMALVLDLAKEKFEEFLRFMSKGFPHWNKDQKGGFAVPLHNVLYYTFSEYTDEMKKVDQERAKAFEDQNKKKAEEAQKKNEEKKEKNAA
jgi:hypothetical protein